MSFCLSVCFLISGTSAFAIDPLPPGVPPPPGAPPPPGSGPNPLPLIRGDGAPIPPPTGTADMRPSNWFPHQPATARDPNNFGLYSTVEGRGDRRVLPDRWPIAPDARLNNAQLEQIQNRRYPYPEHALSGPTYTRRIETPTGTVVRESPSKEITDDAPGEGRPRYQPNQTWQQVEDERAPLPTVKLFCRMLVIGASVIATVLLGFAAFSVVLGHKDSGQRVIGTAAGLMLLFMGYSIYKILVMHAFIFPDIATAAPAPPLPEQPRRALRPANTPVVPPRGDRPRSNMPVVPLGGSINR